jgi:hypothetical protein
MTGFTKPVLLLNPPSDRPVFRDHYCASEAKTTYLWQPLDLLVQGAALRAAGVEVRAVDAVAEGLDHASVARIVRAVRPAAAVVLVSRRTWDRDRRSLQALRDAGVETIVASGDFARFGDEPAAQALADGLIDWSLTDFTSTSLPQTLAGHWTPGTGIATLADVLEGRPHEIRSAPLDYPTLDPLLFDPRRYRLPYPGFVQVASVLATYGCPLHCRYCHVGELGVRVRPVAGICDDFARVRAAGLQRIYVRDATTNARPRHLAAWADAIDRAGLAMPWATFATARPFDDALAARMARAGCLHLQVGFETMDDGLRRDNGKPFSTDDHRRFVQTCHRHGIQATAHVVLGLAGETAETLAATADGLASMEFDYVAVNLAESRPGIGWQALGVPLAIDPGTGQAPAGRPAGGPTVADLQATQRLAYRRVYLRPRRLVTEVARRVRARDFKDVASLLGMLAGWRGRASS